MINCCKDCKERYRACWDSCETYRQAKIKHEQTKENKSYLHYQILKKARLNKWENI